MRESDKFLDKIMSLVDSDNQHFFKCHKADIKAYAKMYHKEQLTLTDVSEKFSKADLLELGGWFDGSPEFVEEVVNDWLNAR